MGRSNNTLLRHFSFTGDTWILKYDGKIIYLHFDVKSIYLNGEYRNCIQNDWSKSTLHILSEDPTIQSYLRIL